MNTKTIISYKESFILTTSLAIITFKVFLKILEDKKYILDFITGRYGINDIRITNFFNLDYDTWLVLYKESILHSISTHSSLFFDNPTIFELLKKEEIQKEIKDKGRETYSNTIGNLNRDINGTVRDLNYYYRNTFCSLIIQSASF